MRLSVCSKVKGQKNITRPIYLGSIKSRVLNCFQVIEYTDVIFWGQRSKKQSDILTLIIFYNVRLKVVDHGKSKSVVRSQNFKVDFLGLETGFCSRWPILNMASRYIVSCVQSLCAPERWVLLHLL